MIDSVLKTLDIPPACAFDKRIPKNEFLKTKHLNATDKKTLRDDVEKIRLRGLFKPATVNIKAYQDSEREYLEVGIVHITLASPARAKRIAEFVHRAIEYPLVLIFTHNDQTAFSVADKRINQADKDKLRVASYWLTDWLDLQTPTAPQKKFMDSFALKHLSFVNFYAFYEDMKTRVIALRAAEHTNDFTLGTPRQTTRRLENLNQIDDLERAIAEHRATLKTETRFNKQVDLNMKIQKHKDTIEHLQKQL